MTAIADTPVEHDVQPQEEPSFWQRLTNKWPVKLVVLAIIVIWLIPTLGMLITSFRPRADIDSSGWWTVFGNLFDSGSWTLDNYDEVLNRRGFGNAFLNTLSVTIPATVIPITVAAFAAYAFSWMNFPARNLIFVIVVGLLVVPLQMALIPILRLYTGGGHFLGITIFPDLNLNGTFLAVWLAHTGFGLPLAVYLLRNYMGSLPGSLIESAEIDGATHFQIFPRPILPLSVPVLASFAIFQFLWTWNDLLVALIFLGGDSDVEVITKALTNLIGGRGEAFHLLTAGAFISMVLPLVVFFSLQRFFVRGLTAGGVKG